MTESTDQNRSILGTSPSRPKAFVLVLMPFAGEFDDIYQIGIKGACEELGYYAERIDEQIFQETILERIYNQIAKADCIVADMSGRNPNVFYEVGYAHALCKPTILLTKQAEDIPFDLKHYSHIVYSGRIVDLKPKLLQRLAYLIEAGATHTQSLCPLHVLINGTPLVSGVNLTYTPLRATVQSSRSIYFQFDLQNHRERSISSIAFRISLEAPENFHLYEADYARERVSDAEHIDIIVKPNGRKIFNVEKSYELWPEQWASLPLVITKQDGPLTVGDNHNFSLSVYTSEMFYEIEFGVTIRG